jgi:hypothetical protein
MLTRTILSAALMLVATVGFAPTASAADRTEIKESRADMRATAKLAKDLDRLAKKWDRVVERDNETKLAKIDADIIEITRAELSRLRGLEVPTKAPRPYTPSMEELMPEGPPELREKMEGLRDDLVALRDMQPVFDSGDATRGDIKAKRGLLSSVGTNVSERAERKEERFRELRSS